MQLEQTLEMYQPMQMQRTQQRERVYNILDLESLSASALYSESKNDVKRDGTMETILPRFIGNDTVKVYINPLTGETNVGYQNGGEKHREYSGSERMINIDRGSRS
jgi:hypothetical protein